MTAVISIGSLKSSGSTTLVLTLAGVAAAAEIPVLLVDASRDKDILTWRARTEGLASVAVEAATDAASLEQVVRAARRRGQIALVDAGSDPETIRMGARLSDRALIPVRFSPLSAYAAVATERLLQQDAGQGRPDRDWALVASAVSTTIPSRIARTVEAIVAACPAPRLEIGLVLRAAYEAPFLLGGTIFTLRDAEAPGLDRARAEAATLAYEAGILGPMVSMNSQRGEPDLELVAEAEAALAAAA